MMIAHISIPADDTKLVAEVLADILEGEATPFPPAGPKGWKVWAGDGSIDLEVVERGALIKQGPVEGYWDKQPALVRHSEAHAAICVNRPEAEVIAIARRAGWTARHCERGGGFFSLAEVWVEESFLIEFLDPAQTAVYRERVHARGWKAKLAEMRPA